jgi:hypothetical protein
MPLLLRWEVHSRLSCQPGGQRAPAVGVVSAIDLYATRYFIARGFDPWLAKALATAMGLGLNFAGRRFVVFPEDPSPDWKPQVRRRDSEFSS